MKSLVFIVIAFPMISFAEQLNIEAPSGKKITIHVDPTITIGQVKGKIQMKEGIEPDQQKLMFAGKELDDKKKLTDYKIKENDTIKIQLR